MGMGLRRAPRGSIGSGRGRTLLEQSFPVTHMRSSIGAKSEPGAVTWSLNMIPVEGYLRQRPPFRRLNSSSSPVTALCQGQLFKADGTVVTWVLDGDSGGTIKTFNWSTLAFTTTVSAANLSSASITLNASGRAYWCVFNNLVVFNDGTNRPWTWDGTSGAGGLTSLTNAPSVCYGRPTVYYAKLFFIKNTDRRTIVWSEENAANTGYEAGGYSNVWTLGQDTTAPIVAVHGTNDGLFYFRPNSIGVIRGAVGTDFVTSGVQPSVSTEHGCVSPDGVARESARDVWFVNQHGSPCVIPAGGEAREVYAIRSSLDATGPSDLFGYDDFAVTPSAIVIADMRISLLRAGLAWPFPTVWVGMTTATGSPGVALLLHEDTGRAVTWVKPFGTGALSMVALEPLYDTTEGEWVMGYVTGGYLFVAGHQRVIAGNDMNTSGAQVDMTCRVITAPLGSDAPLELHYDMLHLAIGGANTNQLSGTAQVLTSRKPRVPSASTAQSWATTTLETSEPRTQHLRLGLNQAGRWARVMVQSPGTLGMGGFSIHGIGVEVVPESVGSDVL